MRANAERAFEAGFDSGVEAHRRQLRRNGGRSWDEKDYFFQRGKGSSEASPITERRPGQEFGQPPTNAITLFVIPEIRRISTQQWHDVSSISARSSPMHVKGDWDSLHNRPKRRNAYSLVFAAALAPYAHALEPLAEAIRRISDRNNVCSKVVVIRYDKYAEIVGIPTEEMLEEILEGNRITGKGGHWGPVAKRTGWEVFTSMWFALKSGYMVGYDQGRRGDPYSLSDYETPFPGPTHRRR
jgi:hypothetical protein